MKKKILAVMLSAVLTVTMLVGCGDSVETGGRAETEGTTTETGERETKTDAEGQETKTEIANEETETNNEESKEIINLVQAFFMNLMEVSAIKMRGNITLLVKR